MKTDFNTFKTYSGILSDENTIYLKNGARICHLFLFHVMFHDFMFVKNHWGKMVAAQTPVNMASTVKTEITWVLCS